MLKTRVITVAVLLPLLLLALFTLDTSGLAIVFGVLVAMALREWAVFSAIDSVPLQSVYIVTGLAVAALVWHYGLAGVEFFILALLFWIAALLRLWRYSGKEDGQGNSGLAWLDGYIVLLPALLGLLVLVDRDASSPSLILIFLLIIWFADTGAYLVGRKWGRHKLAPEISPGKTMEGLAGGLAGAMLVAAVAGMVLLDLDAGRLAAWLLLAALIALMSVAGDLFESLYKRRAGLKDSGNILPGHGGVMDRIDSLCAALPLYILSLHGLGVLTLQ